MRIELRHEGRSGHVVLTLETKNGLAHAAVTNKEEKIREVMESVVSLVNEYCDIEYESLHRSAKAHTTK